MAGRWQKTMTGRFSWPRGRQREGIGLVTRGRGEISLCWGWSNDTETDGFFPPFLFWAGTWLGHKSQCVPRINQASFWRNLSQIFVTKQNTLMKISRSLIPSKNKCFLFNLMRSTSCCRRTMTRWTFHFLSFIVDNSERYRFKRIIGVLSRISSRDRFITLSSHISIYCISFFLTPITTMAWRSSGTNNTEMVDKMKRKFAKQKRLE